jgi:tRNA threonylcarbamoyladenosine biosynthesis protein TsaB
MIVLAVDTCLGACSVALIDGDEVLAARSEPMTRGHQERLAPMAAEVMAEAGLAFSRVDRIAATIGPGSFTGLRVGLAFAKGLAVALDRPCIGVGSLQALAFGLSGRVIASADARHGQVYWQAFQNGAPASPPALSPIADLTDQLAPDTLAGPAAALVAGRFPDAVLLEQPAPDPVAVARLALTADDVPAVPLYLRPPDAKLPGGITPVW